MPAELTFLWVGSLATLATIGYFLESRLPDAKRALFGFAGSYLWAVWAFEASEVYVAQLSQSPLQLRALFYTGLGFSFILVALSLHRAFVTITRSDTNATQ